jgi:hypothetical protein
MIVGFVVLALWTTPAAAGGNPRDAFTAAVCENKVIDLTATGDPGQIELRADGTMNPVATTLKGDFVIALSGFAATDKHAILIRVSVPGKTTTVLGCAWIDPALHYRLATVPASGLVLHVDLYRWDDAAGAAAANALYTGSIGKLDLFGGDADDDDDVTKAKLRKQNLKAEEAACAMLLSSQYLLHQEIAYDVPRLYEVAYAKSRQFTKVPVDQTLWLAVTGVPPALSTLTIAQKQGDEIGFTVSSLASTALPLLAKLVPNVKFAAFFKEESSCLAPGLLGESTTRIHQLEPIDNHHISKVSICDRDDCPGDKDAHLKGTVKLEPSPEGRWTLMTEVSFGLGVHGWRFADNAETVGMSSQSDPAFEPILGASGPEQVFELRERQNPRNAFTTSLLLGRHVSDKLFVGAGPSLTIGASGAALGQLSARVGRNIAGSNVYVTFGVSTRFVNAPEFYAIGNRVTLTQAPGMTTAAPTYASHTAVLLQAEIGLAIDLGTVVSGASSLIGAFGGPK